MMHVMRSGLLVCAVVVCARDAAAQVRASELSTLTQVIDGTRITIEYSRPAVRGRTPFGGVVHWGERWTPGANWATTLEVDKDIRLAQQNIPKGKYSLWMIPRQNEDWTLIVHRKARAYHTQRPDSANELTRIAVKPQAGAHRERLTFDFPLINPEGGVLQFHWGTTVIDIPVRVQPSRAIVLDTTTLRQLAGVYQMPWRGRQVRMDVFAESGKLRARLSPMVLPFDSVFDLLPLSKNRFGPFFYKSGQPFDLEDFVIGFNVTGTENAAYLEWFGISDRPIARGDRQR